MNDDALPPDDDPSTTHARTVGGPSAPNPWGLLLQRPIWRPGQGPENFSESDPFEHDEAIEQAQRKLQQAIERRHRSSIGGSHKKPKDTGNPFGLSDQQLTAMTHLINGKTPAQAARDMGIGIKTLNAHLARAYERIGGTTRTHSAVLLDRKLRE